MKPGVLVSSAVTVFLVAIAGQRLSAAEEPPTEWIDAATGHRVVRLSREPGSASLYFHQNAYTPQGDKLLISTPGGLSTVNLKTRAIELVVPALGYSMGGSSGIEVGRKTRTVYYQRNAPGQTLLLATDLDTKVTREIARLDFPGGAIGGVNADETLIFGKCPVRAVEAGGPGTNAPATGTPAVKAEAPGRGRGRGGGGRMLQFFTVEIATGAVKTFHPTNANLNHHQCSPTDPNLFLFCHEGEWHLVDRIWTIHADGSGVRLMHQRTMTNEIAGHEFFSHDGQMIWYDLQTPRSAEFWLAGVNVYTGERIRYPIERSQWSVHYNVSWDGRWFAGDGGGPDSVANRTPLPERRPLDPPQNGQWIYLFKPAAGEFRTIKVGGEDVKVGRLEAEKLVDLSKHNYRLEPNVTFTPDNRWVVFRSNMHGPTHVYAVEVAKADQ